MLIHSCKELSPLDFPPRPAAKPAGRSLSVRRMLARTRYGLSVISNAILSRAIRLGS